VGLPSLFHHPPPEETPIAVELVTIAPETRATHPNPFRPTPEAKPEPPVVAPAPYWPLGHRRHAHRGQPSRPR